MITCMINELQDPNMLKKVPLIDGYKFIIKDEVTQIWMSLDILTSFFEVSKKKILLTISSIVSEQSLNKQQYLRTISYVKDNQSIQEQQYSFQIICQLGFSLSGPVPYAFRNWIISQFERFIKWGLLYDQQRLTISDNRQNYVQRFMNKNKSIS